MLQQIHLRNPDTQLLDLDLQGNKLYYSLARRQKVSGKPLAYSEMHLWATPMENGGIHIHGYSELSIVQLIFYTYFLLISLFLGFTFRPLFLLALFFCGFALTSFYWIRILFANRQQFIVEICELLRVDENETLN